MAILKRSCCGCSLQHGSKIIAIYYIVIRILAILSCGLFLTILDSLFDYVCTSLNKPSLTSEDMYEDYCDLSKPENFRIISKKLFIVGLVSAGVFLITDFLLLYGINAQRRGFFLPWIVGQTMNKIGSIILVIMLFSGTFGKYSSNYMTSGIVCALIDCGVGIYFLLIIISHFQELKYGGERNPTINSEYSSANTTYCFPSAATAGIPVNSGQPVAQMPNMHYPVYAVPPTANKEQGITTHQYQASESHDTDQPPPYDSGFVNKGYAVIKDM